MKVIPNLFIKPWHFANCKYVVRSNNFGGEKNALGCAKYEDYN